MGSGEKKRRRELNRALNGYSYVYNGVRGALRPGTPAVDMLLEFAAPLMELFTDRRTVLALAVFSWNISFAAEAERPSLISDYVAPLFSGSPRTEANVRKLIDAMIERRMRLYANEPIYFVAQQPDGNGRPGRPEQKAPEGATDPAAAAGHASEDGEVQAAAAGHASEDGEVQAGQ